MALPVGRPYSTPGLARLRSSMPSFGAASVFAGSGRRRIVRSRRGRDPRLGLRRKAKADGGAYPAIFELRLPDQAALPITEASCCQSLAVNRAHLLEVEMSPILLGSFSGNAPIRVHAAHPPRGSRERTSTPARQGSRSSTQRRRSRSSSAKQRSAATPPKLWRKPSRL